MYTCQLMCVCVYVPAVKEPEEIPIVTKLADTEQLPMVVVEMPVVIKLDQDADAGSVDRSKHDLSGQCSRSSWNTYVMMMAKARHQPSTCSARPRLTIKSQVVCGILVEKFC